jgi:hypothetical protein
LLAIAALAAACERGPAEPERWAALYRGGKRTWVPESVIPKTPQKKPQMVIYEVTTYPEDAQPTEEQARAARDLVDRCFEAARRHRWFQFKNGLDQGYGLLFGDRRHYANRKHIYDGVILDCDRPEFLMYYDTPEGKALAGLMFYVDTPTARGPQFAGPLSVWHYHVWAPIQCMEREMLLVGTADEDGRCEKGVPMHRSPEMIHVWFIDRARGPFATSMYLEDEEIDLLMARREAPPLRVDQCLGPALAGESEAQQWILPSCP